jgi:hypothetical protein
MLRITLPTARHSGLFILEGRLTGLWVKELLRVARASNQSSSNIFDLQEVFYVDSTGERALQLLGGCGARFITESAYGKDLCHRLKLERVDSRQSRREGTGRFSQAPGVPNGACRKA